MSLQYRQRTPISQFLSSTEVPIYGISQPNNNKEKYAGVPITKKRIKTMTVIVIALVGAFMYSSFAYTFTDQLFSGFGMDLFSKSGEPTLIIVAIHTILFALFIYVISWLFKD